MAYIIVEDDTAVADSLDILLRAAGHDTRIFPTGEAMVAGGPPGPDDTVVVDLGLPGMSGSTLLLWLQSLADPPRMIVISGKSSGTIAREIRGTPHLTVLRKPPRGDWLTAIAG